jgi:hypothetical protein
VPSLLSCADLESREPIARLRPLSIPVFKRLVPKQVFGIITDVNLDPLVRGIAEREQCGEKNRGTKDVHNDFTHR